MANFLNIFYACKLIPPSRTTLLPQRSGDGPPLLSLQNWEGFFYFSYHFKFCDAECRPLSKWYFCGQNTNQSQQFTYFRRQNYTRNEWRRCETKLEMSGKDEKLHSKRVGNSVSCNGFFPSRAGMLPGLMTHQILCVSRCSTFLTK